MAAVKLHRSELNKLPPVCTCCGAVATEYVNETFAWMPQWAQFTIFLGVLPLFIFMLLTRRTATVSLPYCGKHIRHRPWIYHIVWVGLLLGTAIVGVAIYMLKTGYEDDCLPVFAAGGITFLVSMLVLVFGNDGLARASHITANSITLEQVSSGLVAAIQGDVRQTVPRGGMELQTAKYFKSR